MYIREIRIKSFRHLENVHLGPFVQPTEQSDLVVLAGPNGGGKSSVLELLGYALSNSWSLGWTLHRTFPSNSFEVAIALSPQERHLIREFLSLQGDLRGTNYLTDVAQYFEDNDTYYRAYQYEDGKYQEQSALYNQVHSLVTEALRNHYARPLGFFLRSDRNYPTAAFDKSKLFAYEQITQRDHIWSMAFNTSELQYRDMFDFLVQQRYHYFHRLGTYQHNLELGSPSSEKPTDPLRPYDDLLQRLFSDYSFAQAKEEVPTNLFIQLPSGDVIPFGDLSSGEKEVFFITSFFMRHDVANAIIMVDEPELHLHPEFARLLVRTMQSVKPGNQLWLATHNPEIIDEAGRDRVVYLSKDPKTRKAVVTLGTDESAEMRQLRDLFGYSGYIGIGKSLVFLEGQAASSDRKMFSNLFPELGSKLKFVPSNSSMDLHRINAAVLSILDSNLGLMQFYLVRDRDFLTPEAIKKYQRHTSGRVYVLNRHEIENYLLDEELIAKVLSEIFGKPTDAASVSSKLQVIARKASGEVLRDMLAFRLNLVFRPEDFSVGKLLSGKPILDDKGTWINENIEALKTHITTKASKVANSLSECITPSEIEKLIAESKEEIRQAVFGGNAGWKQLYPGKFLLEMYSKNERLGNSVALQNSLIKELSMTPDKVPSELRRVIQVIADGGTFTAASAETDG